MRKYCIFELSNFYTKYKFTFFPWFITFRGFGKLKGGLSMYELTKSVKFLNPTGLEATTPM